jgi:c-di-GMP-binding flagellar brake protein YcgR
VIYDVVLGERLQMDSSGMTCVCNVQEILPDGRMLISSPQGVGELSIPLMPEEAIELTYHSGGGQYQFKAKVSERIYRDGMLYYTIRFASLIAKSQRRSYVRVDLTIPVGIRILAEQAGSSPAEVLNLIHKLRDRNPSPLNTAPVIKTTTADLSGGGIAFNAAEGIAPGTLILCELSIDGQAFQAEALVTFVKDDPDKRPRFRISAQFIDLDVRQRKRLVKYLMDEEIRIRKMSH